MLIKPVKGFLQRGHRDSLPLEGERMHVVIMVRSKQWRIYERDERIVHEDHDGVRSKLFKFKRIWKRAEFVIQTWRDFHFCSRYLY